MTERNTRLLSRLEEAGLSQSELARRVGIDVGRINELSRLRVNAMRQDGQWRESVEAIASALDCEPHDLFDGEPLPRRDGVPSTDRPAEPHDGNPEPAAWAKIEVARMLRSLPPRERRVVELRMHGATLQDVADDIGVTRERIRQLEMRAHRKLRGRRARSDERAALRLTKDVRLVPRWRKPAPPEPSLLQRYDAEKARQADQRTGWTTQRAVEQHRDAYRSREDLAFEAFKAKRRAMREALAALAERYPED